jgi:hypothetical protein
VDTVRTLALKFTSSGYRPVSDTFKTAGTLTDHERSAASCEVNEATRKALVDRRASG